MGYYKHITLDKYEKILILLSQNCTKKSSPRCDMICTLFTGPLTGGLTRAVTRVHY